ALSSRGATAGRRLGEVAALTVLGLLAGVEGRHRTVVAHHSGPDFATLALFLGDLRTHGYLLGLGEVDSGAARLLAQHRLVTARAELVLAGQVAVHRADREGRRDGQVRQAEAAQRGAYQSLAGLGGGN